MKRPWQAWLAYFLGLAVVIPAMGWLTWQVLAVDRAELLARQQAEREEQISRALWRMDARITPLLAQEAARPEFFYEPIYCEPAKITGKTSKEPVRRRSISPLLREPPEYVLLHFRMTLDCCVDSPQCPPLEEQTWVCEQGISEGQLTEFAKRQAQLRSSIKPEDLLASLPTESWPVSRWDRPGTGLRLGVSGAELPQVVSSIPTGNLGQQQIDQTERIADNSRPSQQAPAEQTPRRLPGRGVPQRGGSDANSDVMSRANNDAGAILSNNVNGDNDLQARNSNFQAFAQQAVINQRTLSKYNEELKSPEGAATAETLEGAFRPVWMGEQLLFARKMRQGEKIVIQGCWLDWNRLQNLLKESVADLLPEFEFVALGDVQEATPNHVLATLPVQIFVPPLMIPGGRWSPVKSALLVAWIGLAIAAVAAAVTMQGIIALSERRAAFVAAVTHELRTPLTTFRMYAEMLAEGMVPERDQQQKYLMTLRTEADRLTHLVENVLQYARLERGRPGKHRQPITMAAMSDRILSRLQERTQQVGLELVTDGSEHDAQLSLMTDPAAVEQILFNLVDNASKYAVIANDKRLHLAWQKEANWFAVRVIDHGPGIPSSGRRKLFAPFSKSVNEAAESAPGVGLGLALSQRLAYALGGKLEWEETPGGGATFCLRLPLMKSVAS